MSYDISEQDYQKAQQYFEAEKRFDTAWWILISLMLIGLGLIFYLDRYTLAEAQEFIEGETVNVEGEALTPPTITNFAPSYLATKGIIVTREQEEDRRFNLIMKQLIQIRNECK